jgi:hypothetical protein
MCGSEIRLCRKAGKFAGQGRQTGWLWVVKVRVRGKPERLTELVNPLNSWQLAVGTWQSAMYCF